MVKLCPHCNKNIDEYSQAAHAIEMDWNKRNSEFIGHLNETISKQDRRIAELEKALQSVKIKYEDLRSQILPDTRDRY